MILGVDVSHNNGIINWNKLKSTGHVQFAVIRTSHGLSNDRQFSANLAACKSLHIPYAFYWYAESNTRSGSLAEARFALSKVHGTSPLFVAYDAECDALAALGKNQTTDTAWAACEAIQKAGYKAMIYTNENWRRNEIDVQFLKNHGVGLWYARPTGASPSSGSYSNMCDIWQYSFTGKLSGNGSQYIDLDVAYHLNAVDPNYCDTSRLTICPGETYTFKTGSKITCANPAVFAQIKHSVQGGYDFTTFKALRICPGVGFYVNGKRACVAVVEKPLTDTPARFTKHVGEMYQFKSNRPVTCGNGAIFAQVGRAALQGKFYFTKFRAVGRGSAGFYVGSTRTNIGTVV